MENIGVLLKDGEYEVTRGKIMVLKSFFDDEGEENKS